PLYPPARPRLLVSTRTRARLTSVLGSSSGWLTSRSVLPRSATISAILRVYASAWVARSSAFLNRAVAMSSIVRVIFLIFCTAWRRWTIARALAMTGLGAVGRNQRAGPASGPRADRGGLRGGGSRGSI